jgi:AmiR/NasT family two-component response regulator
MKGSKVEGNLRDALDRRDVIGQAKGILMERYKIDGSQAFDLLVFASQQTHQKLRDIAEEVATTGELRTG